MEPSATKLQERIWELAGSQPIHSVERDTKVSLTVASWIEMRKLPSGDHSKVAWSISGPSPWSTHSPTAQSSPRRCWTLEAQRHVRATGRNKNVKKRFFICMDLVVLGNYLISVFRSLNHARAKRIARTAFFCNGYTSRKKKTKHSKLLHCIRPQKWAAGKARGGAYLKRYLTDEQRGRRPIFNATLWAAASWPFFRVARSARIDPDMGASLAPRKTAN